MYPNVSRRINDLDHYLRGAVALSVLVHLTLFLILYRTERMPEVTPFELNVTIEPPLAPPSRAVAAKQIVSEPERVENTATPLETAFRAEHDSVVPKEQIKRGDAPEAGASVGTRSNAPQLPTVPSDSVQPSAAAPAKQPSSKEPNTKNTKENPSDAEISRSTAKNIPRALKHLALDADTISQKFALPKAQKQDEEREQRSSSSYRAFSRPSGSGAAFLGQTGIADYLPALPDGDITLLNAKADQFAVFVRRVATQVFSQLRSSGWERLQPADINAISDFSEVLAVLSLDGKLLKVQISGASGSARFDEVLRNAVANGARDPNPPKAAVAEDGTIRFIFKARSWGEWGHDSRRGAPMERRWLLLATGLE